MKRLLILSLLMVQGLWGAAAAGADDYGGGEIQAQVAQPEQRPVPTLKQFILKQLAQSFFDGDQQIKLQIINDILVTGINQKSIIAQLYIAWLNLPINHTKPIIGRQNVFQACIAMGIENPLPEWDQIFVDVSDNLRNDITSLHTRPGTIAHLVHTHQMPAVSNGILDLSYKKLTVCDVWNIYDDLSNISALDLSNNELTALAPGTFAELGALDRLWLSNNLLTTLAPGTFAELGALIHFWLDNNQLTTLVAGTFAGLNALTNLNLNNNLLITLAPGTLAELGALTHLWLSNNLLTTLAPGTFAGLGALTRLWLNNNQLTVLPPNIFAELNVLMVLNLYSNPFNCDSLNVVSIRDKHPEWFTTKTKNSSYL